MKRSNFLVVIFLLFFVVSMSVLLIGIYYFDWFKRENVNNYAIYIAKNYSNNDQKNDRSDKIVINTVNSVKKDLTTDKLSYEKVLDINTKKGLTIPNSDISNIVSTKKIEIEPKLDSPRLNSRDSNTFPIKNIIKKDNLLSQNLALTNKTKTSLKKETDSKDTFGKGSNLDKQEFHSLGEHISEEEYNYRLALIKDLKIKTVVIDSITKGNGVSQEYYKIVFKTNMIPAKVMDSVIISNEFRSLIPDQYLKKERETITLKKGEKIVFENSAIRDILIKWTLGRLTPVEKAWESNAL